MPSNEDIAKASAEKWCVQKKLDPLRNWVASDENFNRIGKMLNSTGGAFTPANYDRALKACLDKNILDLLPVEELPVPKGDGKHRLAEAGGVDQTNNRQSITEIRRDRAAEAARAQEAIDTAAKKLVLRAKAAKQAEDENVTIFVESGPMAGRIDHGATNRAREVARERAGRS